MKKKLIILGLVFIMLLGVVGLTACDNSSNADLLARIEALEAENEHLQNEVNQLKKELEDMSGKISDPGGEFHYDRILVVLTDEASILDKVWAPTDFPGFAFSIIEDKRGVGGAEHLFFHLAEPSRDNVLIAIYYLKTRPEVKNANVVGLDVGFGD